MTINNYTTQAMGQEPSFLGNIGVNAGMGLIFNSFESDFSTYKQFSPFKLGRENRFLQAAQAGAMEGFGFIRHTPGEMAELGTSKKYSFGGASLLRQRGRQMLAKHPNFSSYGIKEKFRVGRKSLLKGGLGGRIFGGAMGLAFSGAAIYSGYKSGGAIGALKAGAQETAGFAAYKTATVLGKMAGISGGVIGMGALAVGAGVATKMALDYGQQKTKDLRNAEFVDSGFDTSGLGRTIRQRSLAALQRSQINGRVAFGNEAAILSGMFR